MDPQIFDSTKQTTNSAHHITRFKQNRFPGETGATFVTCPRCHVWSVRDKRQKQTARIILRLCIRRYPLVYRTPPRVLKNHPHPLLVRLLRKKPLEINVPYLHRPLFLPLIPAATASNQHKRPDRRQQLTGRERLFRISSENRMIFWNR